MEGSCSTGQSPQWAVVAVEEEEEEEEEEESTVLLRHSRSAVQPLQTKLVEKIRTHYKLNMDFLKSCLL
jgi:hypothetical protein